MNFQDVEVLGIRKIFHIFFSHVNSWTKLDLQAHMGQYATHASTTLCPSLMLQLASPAQGGRDSMQTLGAKNESSNKKNWTGPACGEWEINDTFICGGILPRYSTLANKCHWLLWCPEIKYGDRRIATTWLHTHFRYISLFWPKKYSLRSKWKFFLNFIQHEYIVGNFSKIE